MSCPSPTPICENTIENFEAVSDKNNKFQIVLKNKSNSLIISCQMNDTLINHYYEKCFSMEEIQKNKYFYQFDTITEIINEILLKNETKKPLIKEGDNEISLIIYLSTSKIKDAVFLIPEKKKNSEDKIEELYQIIFDMKKEINELKEENKKIKNEIQELKNNQKEKKEEKKDKTINNIPIISSNFKISSNPQIIELGKHKYGKVTMDPYTINKEYQNKIWYIDDYGPWNTIQIYDNLENLKSKNYNEFQVPINGYGTNWTIFKNNLYYSTSTNGNKIGKLNISTNKIECEKTFNDVIGNNSMNQWGGYNDITFISNPESIYLIYQSNTINKLVIKEIEPNSLKITKSWETDAKEKKKYGAFFMIGNTLFAIDNYSKSPTKIIYKYDLINQRGFNINIDFANIGGYDTSLHYCYPTKQLWTINNSKFYLYDVTL